MLGDAAGEADALGEAAGDARRRRAGRRARRGHRALRLRRRDEPALGEPLGVPQVEVVDLLRCRARRGTARGPRPAPRTSSASARTARRPGSRRRARPGRSRSPGSPATKAAELLLGGVVAGPLVARVQEHEAAVLEVVDPAVGHRVVVGAVELGRDRAARRVVDVLAGGGRADRVGDLVARASRAGCPGRAGPGRARPRQAAAACRSDVHA